MTGFSINDNNIPIILDCAFLQLSLMILMFDMLITDNISFKMEIAILGFCSFVVHVMLHLKQIVLIRIATNNKILYFHFKFNTYKIINKCVHIV